MFNDYQILTFNLPSFSNGLIQVGDIPCKGNGMTLGLTNGTNNFGIYYGDYDLAARTNNYGTSINTSTSGTEPTSQRTSGVTIDGSKSGIIADTSSLTLICNMIIKF